VGSGAVVQWCSGAVVQWCIEHWALGTGHWALGTGHWALGTGHWGIGHWALGHWARLALLELRAEAAKLLMRRVELAALAQLGARLVRVTLGLGYWVRVRG